MGQTLSEPETAKESASCENSSMKVGSSCMQGWRMNMEDAHTHILSLQEDPGTAFFGVYDGHGGPKVAEYAGKHLHHFVVKQPDFEQGNITGALQKAFLEIDDAMQADDELKEKASGSTAVCAVMKDGRIYCGNVGDSRAVASVKGVVEVLSFDHKPGNKLEKRRITEAGGWVEFNRVNGNLALSRALGDFAFKKNESKGPEAQVITAFPDVEIRETNQDWEFVLLACDGIWDVLSSQDVVDFVRLRISQGMEPEDICEKLMMRCLAPDCQLGGVGCDNMTVVLVCLLHDKSYQDLSERCKVNLKIPPETSPFYTPPQPSAEEEPKEERKEEERKEEERKDEEKEESGAKA